MLTKLINLYKKEQFSPGILGIFINPFYFARKGLIEKIQSAASFISGEILDIGCGQKPYKHIFKCQSYIGLEIDTPENRKNKKADAFYNGQEIPYKNDSFDSVIISQVFEHIFTPETILREIYRVLKNGGHLLMTVPFIWDEHEQPYDFGRYSSFGIEYLLKKNGFEIIIINKSMADIRIIFQLINVYLFKKTNTKSKILNTIFTIIFMSPFNILGIFLSYVTPKNEDLYLDNIIVAKKR